MSIITREIAGYLNKSSWIRRMFEAGLELKQKYGPDKVSDFSLGNPDLPPVPAVAQSLRDLADRVDQPLSLGYMPNAGYPTLRQALADRLSQEQRVTLASEHVIVTCGAAGGLNTLFRAVLEAGDELVCPAPYFVEYGFYAGNFGGVLVPVPATPVTFSLDLDAIEKALTERTRVLLINSPNNPAGVIYSQEELVALCDMLRKHSERNGREVFLVSDEPYRFLAYDGVEVPPVLPLYPYSVVIGSFSKSLSIAGERIGYIAVSPQMPQVQDLVRGMIFTNRTLGYVNAPAIGQRIVEAALGANVDVDIYRQRRDCMANLLENAELEFRLPQGAFYFFPKVPGNGDDVQFCQMLQDECILAVPGRGFGYPGFIRLTYCMDKAVIERAVPGFKRAADRMRAS